MDAQGGSSDTYLNLGWTVPHIAFGSGYDVAHRKLRGSAFADFPVPAKETSKPSPNDIKYQKHVISTSEELKSRIKADVKATIPLEGVSVETENSYLRNVKTSSTSLTQVVTATIEDAPLRADTSKLKLSQTALSILDGTDGITKFQEKYGEYFIYGSLSRARFNAVCNIQTSTVEIRNQIKSKLEVAATESVSLSTTFESLSKQQDDWMSSDVDISLSGVKGQPASTGTTDKIDSMKSSYDYFIKNYETAPYVGLLCHYSVIDTRIPTPQGQFSFLGPVLELLYQSLYMAQTQLLSSPMTQAAQLTPKISSLCDTIKDMDINDATMLANMKTEVADCVNEAEKWRLREDLIDDVKKLSNPTLNKRDWQEAFNTREWSSGILGVEHNMKYSPIAADVRFSREPYKTDWGNGYQKATYTLGRSDEIIIGASIHSHWNDGTNGWFKMHDGNVGSSEIKVEFSTYKYRGCNWEIGVWSVPKLLYEKA